MKKQIIYIFALLLLLQSVSAVQYFQTRELSLLDNRTTNIHASMSYSTIDGTQENIKSGNPLEMYVLYNTYIDTWNTANPNNKVSYCELLIKQGSHLSNDSVILYDVNYSDDNKNTQFFVNLQRGDSMTADFNCHFSGTRTLEVPVDFTLVTPTWECKSCQEYEWSKTALTIRKAESINSFIDVDVEFIKKFISLNFEFWIIIFWFMLIALFLSSIGLIFSILFWAYRFIDNKLK